MASPTTTSPDQPMSDPAPEPNAVVQRVDALLRRHQDPASVDPDVPVLTEVIDELPGHRREVDAAALEALAAELERAVLERLSPEVERLIEEKLVNAVANVLGDSESMRAELTRSVTQMVREAVAASVASALAPTPSPDEKK
jgi:hypothetical protein